MILKNHIVQIVLLFGPNSKTMTTKKTFVIDAENMNLQQWLNRNVITVLTYGGKNNNFSKPSSYRIRLRLPLAI